MTELKLKEVERLASIGPTAVSRLAELGRDSDEEVRFRAIEAVSMYPITAESANVVRGALSDPDSLVRTAAVEALGAWKAPDAEKLLTDAIDDKDPLVRGAAIVSLGMLASKRSIWTLETRYRARGCCDSDRLSCAIALYSLGRSSFLDDALGFLEHEHYQLRSAAANLLRDFASTSDIPKVLEKLRSSLINERSKATRSSIEGAIEDLVDAI